MSSRLQEQIGDSLRILQRLGAHGAETLVRARDLEHDDEVVLRILAIDGALPLGALEAFEREVELAAVLGHPDIVPLGPLQRREGLVFCVVGGGSARTLESRLQEAQPSTFEESLNILRNVAAALDYAHAHGAVHGALAPALILLPDRGGAQVAGFGEGAILGRSHRSESPAYVAPEQWHDRATGDHHADLYALGVIAYELITGRRRTTSSSVPGVITVDPLPLTRDVPLRPGIGLNVNAAIIRATAKQPTSRFATAGEFVAMLEAPTLAPRIGLPTQRPQIDAPRSRHIAALPLVVVLVLGITLGILAVPSVRHALRRSIIFSSVTDGIDRRARSSPMSPSSRSAASGGAAGPTRTRVASGGASSSQSIFPGAATAAGSGRANDRGPPVGMPTALLPRQGAAPIPVREAGRASGGGIEASSTTISDSSATGFIRVEFDGAPTIVMIDGAPRGRTPYLGRVRAGAHSVSLMGTPSSRPLSRQLHVGVGDTAVVSFSQAESPRH